MGILTSFIQTLFMSFIELLYLLGVLIAIGLLLGVLEKYSNSFLVRAFGPRGVLFTAWIGTPIHEIGHLLQCFIWGHRVTRVKLLELNRADGVLGYVEHQYNRNSLYQQIGNFFIGLGPIFSGIGSLILALYLFVPKSFSAFISEVEQHVTFEQLDIHVLLTLGGAMLVLTKSVFTLENLVNPLFWIFIVLAFSISSHIALSRADIQGSTKGLLMIFIVIVLINILSGILGFDTYQVVVKMAEYNAYLLAFSSVALLFSLLTLFISYFLYFVKKG